jgi:fatty acid desaturase
MRAGQGIEWPTVGVAAAIAAGFAGALAWHEHVPTPVVLSVLAVLGAWYNSLQHEVVHGHPTRWRRANTVFAVVPLGLVLPFGAYRQLHLAHHRTPDLTDPRDDPESCYVAEETWRRVGPVRRGALVALQTLAGRMALGPPVAALRWWRVAVRRARHGQGGTTLAAHVAGVAAVLAVVHAMGMPLWVYVAGVAWGGGALSMLRSFAEHRRVDDGTRSAVVRSNVAFSLLYLNNNLHHTHHARPRLAWYAIPRAHRELGSDAVAARGAGYYRGYAEVARRYLLRPLDPVGAPSRATDLLVG